VEAKEEGDGTAVTRESPGRPAGALLVPPVIILPAHRTAHSGPPDLTAPIPAPGSQRATSARRMVMRTLTARSSSDS
jgi:hypothetical protein